MFNIIKYQSAETDLIDIWLYSFKKWNLEQADTYLDEINDAIKIIANNPNIGINSDHIRKEYQKFKINRHFIWYRINVNTIEVIRVLGEEMDYKNHL